MQLRALAAADRSSWASGVCCGASRSTHTHTPTASASIYPCPESAAGPAQPRHIPACTVQSEFISCFTAAPSLAFRRRAEQLVAQAVVADFNPTAFEKELVKFAETEEYIIRGGREKFKNLPQAMKVRGAAAAAAAARCGRVWEGRGSSGPNWGVVMGCCRTRQQAAAGSSSRSSTGGMPLGERLAGVSRSAPTQQHCWLCHCLPPPDSSPDAAPALPPPFCPPSPNTHIHPLHSTIHRASSRSV